MLNESIRQIRVPDLLLDRPVSSKGFLVPYFVAWVNGDWDFRVIYPEIRIDAMRRGVCWLCGKPLGTKKVFVAGPMCVVTKTSAEPPCHQSCAEYAVQACPFLVNPAMRRNDKDLPTESGNAPGVMIARNPGVTALLITTEWEPFSDGQGDVLIRMGDPVHVKWYRQRRAATQKEVLDSIESGLPILVEQCKTEKTERDQRSAMMALGNQLAEALRFLPRPLPGQPDLLAEGKLKLSGGAG